MIMEERPDFARIQIGNTIIILTGPPKTGPELALGNRL